MNKNKNVKKNFTGFVAYYDDENIVYEKNNYISSSAGKRKATNWHEINRKKLVALELLWHGESKIKISHKEYPHITPSDWYFSHYGYLNMSTHQVKVLSRNIGYIKDKILTLYCVSEDTGIIKMEHRSNE